MKPSEQLWHDEVPLTLYVPAEQSAHPEDPATVPILPAVQLLQAVGFEVSVELEDAYFPGGHTSGTQLAWPGLA